MNADAIATGNAHIARLSIVCVCLSLLSLALFLTETHRRTSQLPPETTDIEVIRNHVTNHPLDYAAYLAMSLAQLNLGQSSEAELALQAALTLAPRDPQVLRMTAYKRFFDQRPTEAIDAIATLLEVDPEARRDAYASLLNVIGTTEAERLLDRWAEASSEHLKGLAQAACQSQQPIPRKLWVATRAAAAQQLSGTTLQCLFDQTAGTSAVHSVYALFLSLISFKESVPYVYDGGFERKDSFGPFSWKLGLGGEFRDGYSIGIKVDRSGNANNRYLSIEFNGRPVTSTVAETHTVLPPGPYSIEYRLRDLTASRNQRFGISVSCAGSTREIAPISHTGFPEQQWREVRQTFIVPADCPAQSLRFDSDSRSWKNSGIKGRVDIDDVVIKMAP